jgi:CYTH domain-containing protein
VTSRVPGEGRYAQVEREQRWVLSALPSGLADPVAIVDRYIAGTRLRLRRMETASEVIYKLAQKVRPRPDTPEVVKLTNIYLSEDEYATLSRLDGAMLEKRRWRGSLGERLLAVDEFGGHFSGLILAEVELSADEPRLSAPPLAAGDVTDDDRFSGGALAQASARQVERLLAYVEGLRGA